MAHLIELTPNKTYATRENAIRAVERIYGPNDGHFAAELRYIVTQIEDGRWTPVFIGQEAVRRQVFLMFPVIV